MFIRKMLFASDDGRKPASYARGLRYGLAVPIRASGRVFDTLSFWSGDGPYWRADDEVATAVGALLALRLTRPSAR
jgi:hypothetical protein